MQRFVEDRHPLTIVSKSHSQPLPSVSDLLRLFLTCHPLVPNRLTFSRVNTESLAHLASGLGHCHHLEELE